MYEYLKKLFDTGESGEPVALTFDQLVEKLDAHDDIKLVNLSDGGFVSKQKFDAKVTELDGVRQQLNEANDAIKSYKDLDVEGIKKAASDWEEKYKTDTAALNQKLEDQKIAHLGDMFMSGYQFTSEFAKEGIRARFDQQHFKLSDDGSTFLGAKEWMKQQMESESGKGAFVIDQPTADPPAPNEPEPAPAPKPKFFTDHHDQGKPKTGPGLAELMRKKNENPDYQVKFT